MFTPEQVNLLSADLSSKNVKQRSQSGKQLSYIEGWHAISECNRIFGFDGWSRETVDLRCVAERERKLSSGGTGWGVTYVAMVRIRILDAENGDIVREGSGSGHGIDRDLGQAHESALKEAETDAMKRALMTFGNQFGLALYDKEQSHVSEPPNEGAETYVARAIEALNLTRTESDLKRWWAAEKDNRDKWKLDPTKGPGLELAEAYGDRKAILQGETVAA